MPDTIANASVLALAGGLEYERVAEKLSSIEPIVMQAGFTQFETAILLL